MVVLYYIYYTRTRKWQVVMTDWQVLLRSHSRSVSFNTKHISLTYSVKYLIVILELYYYVNYWLPSRVGRAFTPSNNNIDNLHNNSSDNAHSANKKGRNQFFSHYTDLSLKFITNIKLLHEALLNTYMIWSEATRIYTLFNLDVIFLFLGRFESSVRIRPN